MGSLTGDGARQDQPLRPAQLPVGVAAFAGRAGEVAEILALAGGADADAPGLISTIVGMPGVGKTTLAAFR
jgi:hypothetical protein